MSCSNVRLPCQRLDSREIRQRRFLTYILKPHQTSLEARHSAWNSIASEAISYEFLHAGFWWLLTCPKKTAILRLSKRIPFITTHELPKTCLQWYSTAMSYKYRPTCFVWCDVPGMHYHGPFGRPSL